VETTSERIYQPDETFESCRTHIDQLCRLCAKSAGERNEATTRLQIIDRLFFDCLGWSRDDVTCEESYGGQYADYTFTFPRKLLIVEAKKEGSYFELPVGIHRLERTIQSLMRGTPLLKGALEQVAQYCQHRGVPYAAITNGNQLIAFMASRGDGMAPFDGRAVVFSSLQHMCDHFTELWNLLSKPGLEQQYLRSRLLGDARPNLPAKLSAGIRPYPGTKGRNPFQSSMKAVSEFILEDVVRAKNMEKTFLRVCYCYSGALSNYSLLSKQILKARYSALFDEASPGPSIAPITSPEGINPELLAQSFARRPILLIGDVGVGKTTFIRKLIANDPTFTEQAIPIYITLVQNKVLISLYSLG
jgi:hypothetical protein